MNKTELWKSPTPIQKRSAEDRLSRAYRGIKSGRWRLVCPMSHSRQAAQGRGHSQVCWPPRLWRWEAPWRRVPPRRWDSFSLDDFSLVLRQGPHAQSMGFLAKCEQEWVPWQGGTGSENSSGHLWSPFPVTQGAAGQIPRQGPWTRGGRGGWGGGGSILPSFPLALQTLAAIRGLPPHSLTRGLQAGGTTTTH